MLTGSLRWGYLIYLGFIFLPPLLLQQTGLWQWVGIILALAAFLAVYHRIGLGKQERWPLLLAFVVIATAVTPINSGSMAMFSYADLLPAISLLLLWQAALFWWCYPSLWLQGCALVVVLGVSVSGLVEQMRYTIISSKIAAMRRITAMARQLERERIARDLHDVLGQAWLL